jgi:hypothetical protein
VSQASEPAWWEDVAHLREAAEDRIAERERAQRDGRDRPSLAPLRPRGDEAPTPRLSGRFRRQGTAAAHSGRPAPAAVARARTATAEATARVLEPAELETAPEPVREHDLDLDLNLSPEPVEAPAERRNRAERREKTERADRPSRREELSRLAQEQAHAAERAAAVRAARGRASGAEPTRRTIEIRGQTVGAPALTAVPSPRDAAPGRHRRPSRTLAERFSAQPDRIAQWAFLLGLFLIAVAALSGH